MVTMCTYDIDGMTNLLLESGCVDKEFRPGQSTLILDDAVKKNNLTLVNSLLKDNSNLSPSALASVTWFPIYKQYNMIVVSLIKGGADLNQRGIRSDFYDPRNSLLSLAAYVKNKEIIRLLLVHHAKVNDWDLLGMGALYFTILTKSLANVKLLLEYRANFNCKDDNENSMLHIAVESGNPELTRVVGKNVPDVNATNHFNQNALHYAIQCTNSSVGVIRQLIDLKVNINALDNAGETPLFYALSLKKNKIAKELLCHRASVNLISKNQVFPLYLCIASSCSPEVTQMILCSRAFLNKQTHDGETVLHCACRNEMVEHVDILLYHGADINIFNKKGQLPVSVVKKHDYKTAAVLLQHIANLMYFNLIVFKENFNVIYNVQPFKSLYLRYFGPF